jgi:hypothetical protein
MFISSPRLSRTSACRRRLTASAALPLSAAPEAWRSAQMPRGRRGIPWYHPGRVLAVTMVLKKAFEGASRLPGRKQDEPAASMVLLHHP